MRKIYLFSILSLIVNSSFSQIRYDDEPISGVGTNFASITPWNKKTLTYFFQSGTNDIEANNERMAIKEAFQIWARHTPVTFVEVDIRLFADIVILWGSADHGDGYPFTGTVLAHAFYPPPNGGSLAGDIHFNDDYLWSLNEQIGSGQPIDLVTVAAHEIGHALGLAHSNVSCALMNPYYYGSHRFLESDDIAGIQSLYGVKDGYTITGTSTVCSSGTLYQIPNLPTGATVSWSVSGGIAISGSNTGSSVTIIPSNTPGQPYVYANINTGCGSVSISRTVNQQAAPTIQRSNLDAFDCSTLTLTASSSQGNTFDWQTDNGLLINGLPSPQYGLSGTVTITSPSGQGGTVSVRSNNSCGLSYFNSTCFTPCNGTVGAFQGGYLNPLSGEPIYIQLDENPNINTYYWYDGQTLIDITYSAYLYYRNWQCGDHGISVAGLTDCGFTYMDSYDYWGLCRGGYYFTTYPNPVSNSIHITQGKNVSSKHFNPETMRKPYTYSLFDAQGKEWAKGQSKGEDVKLNVNNVPNGTYFLHLTTDKNHVEKQQVIVQH